MRVLHLSDRLSDRGGAYWHMLGVIAELRGRGHALHLAVGRQDSGQALPCPTTLVAGLDARGREPAALDAVARAFRPDVVHVHTVVNPAALEWAAQRPSLITVQDHRYFCPTRGKWTLDGRRCREALGRELCAGCFQDSGYFREVYELTRALLMPSRWQEPFGIAGLEAASLGVPVVAYRSGGICEWHPGPGLVEWGDVPALARALKQEAGRRPSPPRGFEPERLMERLESAIAP